MEARTPFHLELDSIHQWMDFIHDRIGDEKLYQISDKVPNKASKRQEYETYVDDMYNVGFAKFPKVPEKPNDSFRSTFDFHAAEGDKLSGLARMWINQYERKRKEQERVEMQKDETQDCSSVLEIVREKLPFDVKFRIISMIPSTSRITKPYDNKLWRELFPTDFTIDCTVKDSAFVTYHKYRIISREFNNRMQKKLMELDSLNLAKVFGLAESQKVFDNLVKVAYLVAFINTKRKFVLGKIRVVDNIDIYQDAPRIYACLQSCYAEANNTCNFTTRTGFLYFNSSIAFYANFRNALFAEDELDELSEYKEEKKEPIYQNNDTEEFGDLFVEPEVLPKVPIDETEEDFIQSVDKQSIGAFRLGIESVIAKDDLEERMKEYKKRAILNKSLEFKDLPTDDIAFELPNNSFEKIKKNELETLFPNGMLPNLIPFQQGHLFKDNYFNILIRRKLRKEIPELFTSIYDDNITLFKSLTLSYNGNPYNHLILHLVLENGKEIPTDLDKKLLLSKTFKKNELTEITFVDFVLNQICSILRNTNGARRRRDNNFGYLSLFSKENITFDEDTKSALVSSFGNNVKNINLHFYGKYMHSLNDETEVLLSHFPNVREIRIASRLKASQQQTSAGILQNTHFEFKEISKLLVYELQQIHLRAIDANTKTVTSEETKEGDNVNSNPLFEKRQIEENSLNIDISSIHQFEHHEIGKLENELGIDLIRYPGLVVEMIDIMTSIDKTKELADYFLDRGFYESYLINSFYNYSEDVRILKEYYIYRNRISKNPLLRKELVHTLVPLEEYILDMYCGLDLISNPIEFEKMTLSPFPQRCESGYGTKQSITFVKLLIAKLYYENSDISLFQDYLQYHFNLSIDKETIEKIETSIILNGKVPIELSKDRNIRSIQLFLHYISKPKGHALYKEHKLDFNLDKIFAYLVLFINAKVYDLVESLLTLGHNVFSNFNEVFTKTYSTHQMACDSVIVTDASSIVEDSPGNMYEYETKLERRKEFLKMMYCERITDPDTKLNPTILDKRVVQNRLLPQNTTLFQLMFVLPTPFILYAVDLMTPAQLIHQDNRGNTCLHKYAEHDIMDVEIFEKIIEKQPEILNMVNNDLNSVLHIFAYLPFPQLFSIGKVLVEKYGANKDLVNAYGLTAYEMAVITLGKSDSGTFDMFNNLSWLLPTTSKTKKDLFIDSIKQCTKM